MSILVTGGAGYIGSHCVKALREAGREVIIYDNLSTGHRQAVQGAPLVRADLRDARRLEATLRRHKVTAVIHFAAKSLVGESMKDPQAYYDNNVTGTLSLLQAMRGARVGQIVFSSSAAAYGEPEKIPITEDAAQKPTNVYGRTKVLMEQILRDFEAAYGLRWTALRYFNVAGADDSGEIGEDHRPETHLIPIVFQVLLGQRDHLDLYGTDYPTRDGTCIRDYIHVTDLIDAHLLALKRLEAGGASRVYNLGNGQGFSNREIVQTAEKVTATKVKVNETGRRAGDPAVLVASSDRAVAELGWQPQHAQLDKIVASAWRWHSAHPRGYA